MNWSLLFGIHDGDEFEQTDSQEVGGDDRRNVKLGLTEKITGDFRSSPEKKRETQREREKELYTVLTWCRYK